MNTEKFIDKLYREIRKPDSPAILIAQSTCSPELDCFAQGGRMQVLEGAMLLALGGAPEYVWKSLSDDAPEKRLILPLRVGVIPTEGELTFIVLDQESATPLCSSQEDGLTVDGFAYFAITCKPYPLTIFIDFRKGEVGNASIALTTQDPQVSAEVRVRVLQQLNAKEKKRKRSNVIDAPIASDWDLWPVNKEELGVAVTEEGIADGL